MSDKRYVVEISVKEVIPETVGVIVGGSQNYNSADRGKTVKTDRQVFERTKTIVTTATLGEAIDRVLDWAEAEKKYLPGGPKNHNPIELTSFERPK